MDTSHAANCQLVYSFRLTTCQSVTCFDSDHLRQNLTPGGPPQEVQPARLPAMDQSSAIIHDSQWLKITNSQYVHHYSSLLLAMASYHSAFLIKQNSTNEY